MNPSLTEMKISQNVTTEQRIRSVVVSEPGEVIRVEKISVRGFAVFNPKGNLTAVFSSLRDAVWYVINTSLKGCEDEWKVKGTDLQVSNFTECL